MSAPGTCKIVVATPSETPVPQFVLAGNLVRFLITFTDMAGAPADPTTVIVTVGTSYYDEESLTPVRDAAGSWHADWDSTTAPAATYYCDVSGTGALEVSAESSVKIRTKHL